MRQILFQWGPMAIPAYGFFIGLGIIVGMHLSERWSQASGLPKFLVLDTVMIAVLGGLVGAKLSLPVFGDQSYPGGIDGGGRSYFGALSGALAAGIFYLSLRQAPLLKVMDAIFVYLPLGHAIGRMGCLFYGCCHGRICPEGFLLGIDFPPVRDYSGQIVGSPAFVSQLRHQLIDSDAIHSLSVYPTQIFAVVASLLVFAALVSIRKYTRIGSRAGSLVSLYLVLYGGVRFIEEYFRETSLFWGIMSKAQIVCLVLIFMGAVGLYWMWKPGRKLSTRSRFSAA